MLQNVCLARLILYTKDIQKNKRLVRNKKRLISVSDGQEEIPVCTYSLGAHYMLLTGNKAF